jgi:hypothetical protein
MPVPSSNNIQNNLVPPSNPKNSQNPDLKTLFGSCQFFNDKCPDKYHPLGNFSIQGTGSGNILTCGNVQNTKPAKAIAQIKNNAIYEIHITDQGHGFNPSSPPKVSIEGGKGHGATAEAVIDDDGFLKIIKVINPGYNYTTLPTIRIVDDSTSILNIDDGYGGFIGRNATVSTDYAPGSIVSIALTSTGANFNRNELATIQNVTQGNSVIIQATPGNRGTTYRKLKTTFNGAGAPLVSGVKNLPGRYTDTKGFLSWNNRIQDNYYYQEFSYVVQINELVNKYRDIIKNLVHPAGTKMFGTYTIRSGATMPFTLVQSSSNIHNVRNLEPVYATEIFSGTKITTDSSLGHEINPNDIMTAFVSKDVDIGTEVATANGNPSVTVRFLGLGTANVETTDSFGGTGIYPGTAAESITTSDEQSAIGTYPGAISENTIILAGTQVAIGTYPADGTANTAVSDAPSAIKIVLVNGTYVQVTVANNIASFYDSAQISTYEPFIIDALNGTPRLVRIAKGTPWFANNALRANTGNIQVGGVGTTVIAAAIGSGSTTTYQVNAIFSNTYLTLRTNYVPVTSNATFAYSVG